MFWIRTGFCSSAFPVTAFRGEKTADLHCDVVAGRRRALQHLVVAAAGTARQHHAGRDEDVLHLVGILLQDLDEQLPRLTQTLVVHLH